MDVVTTRIYESKFTSPTVSCSNAGPSYQDAQLAHWHVRSQ